MDASAKTIRVREACSCHANRWFECDCDVHIIAEYECLSAGITVQPDEIKHVANLHPGCDLIYI